MDISGIYFPFSLHFSFHRNCDIKRDVTLTADSICLYIPGKHLITSSVLLILTLSQSFCSKSVPTGSGSIWPFMFQDTFDLSEWIMFWFPFSKKGEIHFLFIYPVVVFFSPGLNWSTATVDVSVIIIVSSATRLWCKDLRPTINKAEKRCRLHNKDTLVQLGMMERGEQ